MKENTPIEKIDNDSRIYIYILNHRFKIYQSITQSNFRAAKTFSQSPRLTNRIIKIKRESDVAN